MLENYGAGHPRIQRIVSTVRAPSSEPVSESRALDWMEWVAQGALDIDDVQLSGTEIIQNAVIELASIRKCAALSTREEAPAPTCQRCGGEIAGWCCQKCPAEFRENDDGVLVFDDDEEAPAEAGEASPLDRLKALSVGNGLGPLGMEQFRSALSAFRARSSVPEARALAPSAPDQAKEGE